MSENSEIAEAVRAVVESKLSDFQILTDLIGLDPKTDLRGCRLSGLSFVDADLSGANLSHSDLSGTIFDGANLAGANLSGSRLVDASLRNTNLAGVTLLDAEINNCDFFGAEFDDNGAVAKLLARTDQVPSSNAFATDENDSDALDPFGLDFWVTTLDAALDQFPDDLFELHNAEELKSKLKAEVIGRNLQSSQGVAWGDVYLELSKRQVEEKYRERARHAVIFLSAISIDGNRGVGEEGSEEETSDGSSEEDFEEDEGKLASAKTLDKLVAEYSFKEELVSASRTTIDRSTTLSFAYRTVIRAVAFLKYSYERFKEMVKSILKFIGLESIFVVIDRVSSTNATLRFLVKTMGSIVLPAFILISVFFTVSRILSNPLRSLTRWLAREFDFKVPGDDVPE